VTTTEPPFLDLADPAFSVRSEAVRAARERDWWARTSYGIAVLRYDEVRTLLADRRLAQGSAAWPQHNGVTTGPFVDWWSKTVLNLEGEDHHRLRRLLTPAFAPRFVTPLVPRFGALADELIDRFAFDGRCEFVSAFAEPYAARVLTLLLGLPDAEWEPIARWSSELGLALGVHIARDLDRVEAALEALYGYADGLIAERRAQPGDDAVTRLVQAHDDQDALTHDELRVSIVLLIFGGIDTTRNQLGLAMQTFIEQPDQWALLARRPELGLAAIDEVMRITPTTTWITREAREDVELHGVRIPAGTTVHLLAAAAGTDPRAFEDGERFDVTVKRARHVGFGGGIHHCLGHFVARTDMGEALPILARRLRDPRIDGEARWLPMTGNTGPVELPIAFTPGA
jgi:cytochrome P450